MVQWRPVGCGKGVGAWDVDTEGVEFVGRFSSGREEGAGPGGQVRRPHGTDGTCLRAKAEL